MTNKHLALSILGDHLNKIGWPLHVNQLKLDKHASIVPFGDLDDTFIVEMKRHRQLFRSTLIETLEQNALGVSEFLCARRVNDSEGFRYLDLKI
jgi:hypothetical protein